MSKKRRQSALSSMLELWRPPHGAGDPVGCLTTTYTFEPSLFDEQCLARFLEVESEPNREDLAFLLERESRLGGVYAGVLVDHSQSGVEHSLRWDVLPVRIAHGKQHAKLSVIAWTDRIRLIVGSANLTDSGYRYNHEVAVPLDATADEGNGECIEEACQFLRALLGFVPGATPEAPQILRAQSFLDQVQRQSGNWTKTRRSERLRQRLIFTLPPGQDTLIAGGGSQAPRSSLDEAVNACRLRGGSPDEAWVASPFFDPDDGYSQTTAALCKSMARGITRRLTFCVPAIGEPDPRALRLAAPRGLLDTPGRYSAEATFEVLPQRDADKNQRPWHAKMLALRSGGYSALLIGSSNFTSAGLGIGSHRNAEANLLTIAEREAYAREAGELEAIWPEMSTIDEPEEAEWLGPKQELDEDEREQVILPAGFLSALYRAGDDRRLFLQLGPDQLPGIWSVHACGQCKAELLQSSQWAQQGRLALVNLPWEPVQPPEKLRVCWEDGEAFWPLNVEDARRLPPPPLLEKMSADDMLLILAASDPSAAVRAWARQQQSPGLFDEDLDTAAPVDLDPLRRYDLRTTFLHRVRRRARVLAALRENLQRSVWSRQALEWRLRGLIGVEPLAMRMLAELAATENAKVDEALLTLGDFLIVLREVDYHEADGAVKRAEFEDVYRPFLRELVVRLDEHVRPSQSRVATDLAGFWDRVVKQCQR